MKVTLQLLSLKHDDYVIKFSKVFSDILERNNDYSDTLDFRRWRVGLVGVVMFFVFEVLDQCACILYIHIKIEGADALSKKFDQNHGMDKTLKTEQISIR